MIIITAPVHPILLDTLKDKGYPFVYLPQLDYNGLLVEIPSATGLIVATHIKIDRKMIDLGSQLKWIGRLGSGMEHIDVAYANGKNIICESSPEGNRNAVAEHTLGLLLNLLRNINKSANELKKSLWLREENRGFELAGKVVGIIGFGNTGSAFAKLLSSFDVTILAYDKYKVGFGNEMVKESSEEEIYKQADVISFHVPLNAETQHMADGHFFEALSKNPLIINSSRGKIIETNSLIYAIKSAMISGAALDVLENENLTSYTEDEKNSLNFLVNQNNVIITPHIAGYSYEATFKMSCVLLEKLGIL